MTSFNSMHTLVWHNYVLDLSYNDNVSLSQRWINNKSWSWGAKFVRGFVENNIALPHFMQIFNVLLSFLRIMGWTVPLLRASDDWLLEGLFPWLVGRLLITLPLHKSQENNWPETFMITSDWNVICYIQLLQKQQKQEQQ